MCSYHENWRSNHNDMKSETSMNDKNFIKLNRNILEWEWFSDVNTCRLFIYMLLKANWKEGKFHGTTVPRGSFVSSIQKLSQETNLSVQQIKTAINHLKSTGEITSKATNKYTVFTIKNYNLYQDVNQQDNKQPTNEQQTSNKQLTTIEERKNIKKERIKEKDLIVSKDTICPEPEKTAPDSTGIFLPLADGTFYEAPVTKLQKWGEAFPAVDITGELKKMYLWLDSNPTRKKTRRGIERFIYNWLERTQNKGGSVKAKNSGEAFVEEMKGWMGSG